MVSDRRIPEEDEDGLREVLAGDPASRETGGSLYPPPVVRLRVIDVDDEPDSVVPNGRA